MTARTSNPGALFRASAHSDAAALRARIDRLAGQSQTPGLQLVVVDRAGILFEHTCGFADLASQRPMDADTSLMAYSMSKTITAAAVLRLVQDGRLRLDDPVARYLPSQPYGDRITIRQLVAHTSGIGNPIPLRWVHPAAHHGHFDESAALDAVLRKHGRLRSAPGARFAYSNLGYWLLGSVIAAASGTSFTDYVTKNVFAPLGLVGSQLGYTILDPARHASGYLEKYSLMNVFKRLLIDGVFIGEYDGRWLHIRDHYVNGPAFGGLVGTARGFAAFLRDQLAERSALFDERTRSLFYEQQRVDSGPIPMTLGWHIGTGSSGEHHYKEGGGGGFHCLMRIHRRQSLGMVVMSNATTFDVYRLLDTVEHAVLSR